jgi:MFS family permease
MVFMGQMVATIVMLPIGGTLADRLPRVRVIVTVQIIVGALVAFQAGLIAADQARVVNLALIAAAVNIATAISSPARFGLVSALVAKQQLPQANALATLGHYGIIMAGPAVGGFVVAVAGPAWGVGWNAASFWLSAALLYGIKAPPVVLAAMGLAVAAVTWRSLIQQKVPDAQQGRVAAWVNIGEIGFTPIIYLLVGPAVASLGLQGTLLTCAIGIVIATLAPLAHPDVRQLTLLQTPEPALSATTSAAVSPPDRRNRNAGPSASTSLRPGDRT